MKCPSWISIWLPSQTRNVPSTTQSIRLYCLNTWNKKILLRPFPRRSAGVRHRLAWRFTIQTEKYLPSALLLLESYLNGRSFKVKLGTIFQLIINFSRSLQGSDIVPFLHILFTAGIPTLIGTNANDTAILSSNHNLHEANFQLQNHLSYLIH